MLAESPRGPKKSWYADSTRPNVERNTPASRRLTVAATLAHTATNRFILRFDGAAYRSTRQWHAPGRFLLNHAHI